MAIFTLDCPLRDSTTFAAQWIRLAYHDMSTHNVEDGTGGLDASIRFELNRAENVGKGMENSLADFSNFQTPHVSMADVMALGTIFAYANCGGPNHTSFPFRAGRVDAKSAGPPGVPEPQQDLQSHIDSFKRQGFTPSEMIALVACGHAVGGVRKADFPTVVPDKDFALFNGDGYLDGTTPNPLVVSPAITMRSDLRIFSSDGNATMQRLAQGDNLDNECASLIERMINTVPKGVTLTEPILPIEYKVGKVRLFPSKDSNSLKFTTTLRALDVNPNRKITLFWTDREGARTCPATGCSSKSTEVEELANIGNGFDILGMTASMYHFEATINATTSISKFWFEIDEGDGSAKKVVDNIGQGYGIDQDTVLFDPARSALGFLPDIGSVTLITVAVQTSKFTSLAPSLVAFNPVTSAPEFLPEFSTVDLELDTTLPPTAGYTFFTAKMTTLFVPSFDVIFEGKVMQEWDTRARAIASCFLDMESTTALTRLSDLVSLRGVVLSGSLSLPAKRLLETRLEWGTESIPKETDIRKIEDWQQILDQSKLSLTLNRDSKPKSKRSQLRTKACKACNKKTRRNEDERSVLGLRKELMKREAEVLTFYVAHVLMFGLILALSILSAMIESHQGQLEVQKMRASHWQNLLEGSRLVSTSKKFKSKSAPRHSKYCRKWRRPAETSTSLRKKPDSPLVKFAQYVLMNQRWAPFPLARKLSADIERTETGVSIPVPPIDISLRLSTKKEILSHRPDRPSPLRSSMTADGQSGFGSKNWAYPSSVPHYYLSRQGTRSFRN
ncbi:hypothetical protein PQX77_006101 [Marasmius sp. AFHP31]|nr:hypothetical protein PQX77_006101 [Marasmius sp. AFHP31]